IASAGREREYTARDFIYAPGGFESGALALDSHMSVSEPALGLPLRGADAELISEQYWDGNQPLFRVGVTVNEAMQVTDPGSGDVLYENLYCAGGIIAGSTRWAEKSGEGIALGSAVRAVDSILSPAPVLEES
ncbi:MAG: hypothetical protein L0H22_10420, partial [Brevibacterium aurantiacum]|nr:hypothetical protein [Brevibacterium aurantiacum]